MVQVVLTIRTLLEHSRGFDLIMGSRGCLLLWLLLLSFLVLLHYCDILIVIIVC